MRDVKEHQLTEEEIKIAQSSGDLISNTQLERTPEEFRDLVLNVQQTLIDATESNDVVDRSSECTLTHRFVPKDEKYGCHVYAREIFMPKNSLVIGKIHRHQHLNFISKGEVLVATEFGNKHLKAPCTFISEVGLKRVVYMLEDTVWTTVHLTEYGSEEDLDKIEDEVIAPDYEDLFSIVEHKK